MKGQEAIATLLISPSLSLCMVCVLYDNFKFHQQLVNQWQNAPAVAAPVVVVVVVAAVGILFY